MAEGRARDKEDPRGSGQGPARPRSARPQTTWPESPGYQQDHSHANARNAPSAQAQQTQSLPKTRRPQTPRDQQDHRDVGNTVKRGWLSRLFRRRRHQDQQPDTGETAIGQPVRDLSDALSRRHDRPQLDASETARDRPFPDTDEPEPWPRFVGQENRLSVLEIARKILKRALKEVARFKEALKRSGFLGIKAGSEARNYPDSEFQRCLGTLNDRSLWEAILREQGLAGNPKAVEAVKSLIERIQGVTTAQIEEDSLALLELSIKLLLSQINRTDARSVSQERVQHLRESVQKIGWQVAAASAAVSASTVAGGSDLTPRLILAGLSGSAAATAIGAIQGRHNHGQKSKSSASALLLQLHDDMIEQVDVLTAFIGTQNVRTKEVAEENSLLRFSLLRARLTVMYTRQVWAGCEQFAHMTDYQNRLTALAKWLSKLDQCIERQAFHELREIEREISAARLILAIYRFSLATSR